eukprot:5684636-Alexandrium_andersonii.AAC.1
MPRVRGLGAQEKTFGAEDVPTCSFSCVHAARAAHVQFIPTARAASARCTCRALLSRRWGRGPSQERPQQ